MAVTFKSRRTIAVLAFIGVCIAAAIVTVSVTHDDANDSNSRNDRSTQGEAATVVQVSAVASEDPLIVVGLRVVQGTTDDAARDQCTRSTNESTAEWIVAGKNLNVTTSESTNEVSKTAFTYLCMQQVRSSLVRSSVNSSKIVSAIRSVHVVHAASCLAPLTRLFSPRPNVSVCTQSIAIRTALETGSYISDITATVEGNYFRSVPGWTTDPISIAMLDDSLTSSAEVYLAIKRPHRAASAIRVLSGANVSSEPLACSSHLGSDWERAGSASLKSGNSTGEEAIVCLLFAPTPVDKVIEKIEVVSIPSPCSAEFNETQQLTSDRTLCTKYAAPTAATSYIGELQLQALQSAAEDTWRVNGFETLPVQTMDGTAAMVLAYRTFAAIPAAPSPILPVVEAETSTSRPLQARATEAGLTFKILQLADLHFTGNSSFPCRNAPAEVVARGETCTEAYTTAFVNQVLDEEKPDFVVFTGDNIEVFERENFDSAIAAVVDSVEARKIPYAVVFGNHDDENGLSRDAIANAIVGRPYSYMLRGPSTVSGVGNYDLSLQAPSSGPWGAANSTVFNMYFLDSHAYPDTVRFPNVKSGYDWIKPDQVDFYRRRSIANRENATNTTLPAIMFFHIPLPEYASVGSQMHRSGEKHEVVTSPEINTNLFSALVEMNEVKATFVGHDHVNEFCYKRQGIQLCHGGGTGFAQAYGDANFARRARVIEWSIDNADKRRITSWKRHHGSAFATRQIEEVLYQEL